MYDAAIARTWPREVCCQTPVQASLSRDAWVAADRS
jgi:hypothetical protein